MANREIIVEKIAHLQEIDVASDLAINAPGTVTFSSDVAVTNTLTAAILTATNYVSTNEVVSPSGQNLILVADQQLNLTATSDSMTLQTLGAGKNIVLSPASGAVVAFTGNLDMTTNSLLNVSSISSAANLTLSPASGNLLVAASIEPTTDNTNALGSSGNQWSAVNTYTVTNTAATSNLVVVLYT